MIRCTGLTVALSGRVVLDAIDVEARRGEAIAIVGRNAAGKTTLVRAMAGLIPPARGDVLWDGVNVSSLHVRVRAQRCAFVPQRPQVSARFSVRETIELGRFALPPNPQRIAAALDRTGLDLLADRPYHELSLGQQQRVALARVFAQIADDGCLLVDEPFAAMDLGEADRCLKLLREHAQRGVVVAVLHDLAQARALADQVWLLDAGNLIARGRPTDLFQPEFLAAHFGVPFGLSADGAPVPRFGG
ncbi:MAG: ABC transporter ATP-binding protein [Phycisphaerae bacterium]|nr:ABC transporter ATP-binding protein [Phycisphaerae bacterium]